MQKDDSSLKKYARGEDVPAADLVLSGVWALIKVVAGTVMATVMTFLILLFSAKLVFG